MDTQQQAVDRVLALVRAQGIVETDPVDFVEFLLRQGLGRRDLDAIVEDIISFALHVDDLHEHVKGRLEVLQDFQGAQHPTPASDPRLVAYNIVGAIRSFVTGRLIDRTVVATVVPRENAL